MSGPQKVMSGLSCTTSRIYGFNLVGASDIYAIHEIIYLKNVETRIDKNSQFEEVRTQKHFRMIERIEFLLDRIFS